MSSCDGVMERAAATCLRGCAAAARAPCTYACLPLLLCADSATCYALPGQRAAVLNLALLAARAPAALPVHVPDHVNLVDKLP
eukprot:SAG31_NODE_2429_length_5709_cov_19.399287_1_plen_83_part_00